MWRKAMEYQNNDLNIKMNDTHENDKEVGSCYFEKINTMKFNRS